VSRRRIAARRGVVLGLLVLCVLIFTSFFREGEGGFLHQFKGTVGAVVTPVKEVAVGAVQPLKDGWNWFAELRGARDRAERLEAENEALRSQIIDQTKDKKLLEDFRAALKVQDDGAGGYAALSARVIGRPADLSHRVELDKGSSSGIVKNSLVFAPHKGDSDTYGVLVGTVTSVRGGSSEVTLITDPTTAIGATLADADKQLGLLTSTVSGELSLTDVPGDILIREGDEVVTSGIGTRDLPSLYPQGLPIGKVRNVGSREPGQSQTVQVTPYAKPVELTVFTVLVPESPEARRRAAPASGG
jgi:rod shape-determining protein MreC